MESRSMPAPPSARLSFPFSPQSGLTFLRLRDGRLFVSRPGGAWLTFPELEPVAEPPKS